jgi:branched-chain amino acid transport system substrate-binding protein
MTQTEFYSLLNEYKKLNVAVLAGTTSGTASIAAFIKQAREIALDSVICADGIGYVGEWYKLMGRSADHVLDSAPLFVTPEAEAWKKTMDKQYGLEFGGFGGICYDSNKFFIKIARRALEKYGTIDKKTLHRPNLEEVIPGKLTYINKEGALIMENYKFTPETAPSCIFGPQYYYYPIVQYMAGKANVVWPEAWKATDFKARK